MDRLVNTDVTEGDRQGWYWDNKLADEGGHTAKEISIMYSFSGNSTASLPIPTFMYL